MANWLVGIATMMTNCSNDFFGKAMGVFLPISAFAALGFEHCIANQFIITMGILQGAKVSGWDFFITNLLPATLGNWVGGAVLVGILYSYAFGNPSLKMSKSRFW